MNKELIEPIKQFPNPENSESSIDADEEMMLHLLYLSRMKKGQMHKLMPYQNALSISSKIFIVNSLVVIYKTMYNQVQFGLIGTKKRSKLLLTHGLSF